MATLKRTDANQHGWGFFVERPTKYHRGVINMEIHWKFHGKIKEHMGKSRKIPYKWRF
jgi:hypothetical protein